jgi:transcriptional regulator with XRE-family HTH domain
MIRLSDDLPEDFLDHLPRVERDPRTCPVRHRLREVRTQEGLTLRSVAERMGVRVSQVAREEQANSDLTLSDLYRWQTALRVPIEHLLVDEGEELSRPVAQRAQLLKIMKTAVAIRDRASPGAVRRLAEMLSAQLVELMPELAQVTGWVSVGQPRTSDDLGRVADHVFADPSGPLRNTA